MQPIYTNSQYFAIPVSSLQEASFPDFSLYQFIREQNVYILYRSADLEFNAENLQKLTDNRIAELYIRAEQKEQYFNYVIDNLSKILNSNDRSTHEKIEVITHLVQIIAQKVFNDPLNEEVPKQAYSIFSKTMDLIQDEPRSFIYLVEMLEDDYELYSHALNVSLYSLGIASTLNIFTQEELVELCMGALYHDIGKLHIPNYILSKKGPLTRDERKIIQTHPFVGLEIMMNFKPLSHLSKNVILQHHERFNGKGYPLGLSRNQIAPEAQIVAIADIFDAITTNRTFRRALPTFQALKMMLSELSQEVNAKFLKEFILMLKI